MKRKKPKRKSARQMADLLSHAAFRSSMDPEVQDEARGLLAEWDALATVKKEAP